MNSFIVYTLQSLNVAHFVDKGAASATECTRNRPKKHRFRVWTQ
jgi:hypothetical protein